MTTQRRVPHPRVSSARRASAVGLLVLALSAACTSSAEPPTDDAPSAAATASTLSDAQARKALLRHLAGRTASASMEMGLAQTLRDVLPNRRYQLDGQDEPVAYAAAVVIGKVLDAQPGAGFVHPNDAPKATEVAYDDPDALWRTVEATVDVRQGWGDVTGGPIKVGIVVNGSGLTPAEAVHGVKSLGQVFLVLDEQGSFLTYDKDLFSVGASGSWLGVVDNGELRLPAMEEPEEFLDDIRTVQDLREEASEPDEVIDASG